MNALHAGAGRCHGPYRRPHAHGKGLVSRFQVFACPPVQRVAHLLVYTRSRHVTRCSSERDDSACPCSSCARSHPLQTGSQSLRSSFGHKAQNRNPEPLISFLKQNPKPLISFLKQNPEPLISFLRLSAAETRCSLFLTGAPLWSLSTSARPNATRRCFPAASPFCGCFFSLRARAPPAPDSKTQGTISYRGAWTLSRLSWRALLSCAAAR